MRQSVKALLILGLNILADGCSMLKKICTGFKYFELQAKNKTKGEQLKLLKWQTPAHMGLVAGFWLQVKFPQH